MRGSILRIALGVCVCVLSAAEASAQAAPDLSRAIAKQQTVRVTDDRGQEFSGRLQRADGTTFTLRTELGNIPFAFQRISTIERRGDSLRNGLITGLVIGTTVGLLSASTMNCTEGLVYPSCGSRGATVAGAVAGWTIVTVGIDLLKQGWTRIYPSRRPASAASIPP